MFDFVNFDLFAVFAIFIWIRVSVAQWYLSFYKCRYDGKLFQSVVSSRIKELKPQFSNAISISIIIYKHYGKETNL